MHEQKRLPNTPPIKFDRPLNMIERRQRHLIYYIYTFTFKLQKGNCRAFGPLIIAFTQHTLHLPSFLLHNLKRSTAASHSVSYGILWPICDLHSSLARQSRNYTEFEATVRGPKDGTVDSLGRC